MEIRSIDHLNFGLLQFSGNSDHKKKISLGKGINHLVGRLLIKQKEKLEGKHCGHIPIRKLMDILCLLSFRRYRNLVEDLYTIFGPQIISLYSDKILEFTSIVTEF